MQQNTNATHSHSTTKLTESSQPSQRHTPLRKMLRQRGSIKHYEKKLERHCYRPTCPRNTGNMQYQTPTTNTTTHATTQRNQYQSTTGPRPQSTSQLSNHSVNTGMQPSSMTKSQNYNPGHAPVDTCNEMTTPTTKLLT